MKFILIWTLLLAFPLHASVSRSQILKDENFCVPPSLYHKGDDLKYWNTVPQTGFPDLNQTKIVSVIKSQNCNTFIDEITLYQNRSGLRSMFIRSRIDSKSLDINQNYKLQNILLFRSDRHDLEAFLTSLQRINYLPDCLLDIIISALGVEDFRFTEEDFINQLNAELRDNGTVDEFRGALTKTLATIPNPNKAQHWIAVVIRQLTLDHKGDRDLLMALCHQVQDPAATSLFNEVRKTESELFFTDASGQYSRQERHLLAIKSLLRTSGDVEAQRMLTLWIKSLHDGPHLTAVTLPAPQQDDGVHFEDN